MKTLSFLALLMTLMFGLTLSSCQKSSDNSSKPTTSSIYKELTDTQYIVKNGTVTFTQDGKTTTYTAPEDLIYINVVSTGLELHAGKAFVGDVLQFSFTEDENNKILSHFYASHEFSADDIYYGNGTSSINVKEFNNLSDGVLLKADYTCSFYNPFTNSAPFSTSGTINLMFTKKS